MDKLIKKFKEKYIQELAGSPDEVANVWYKDVVLKSKKKFSLTKLSVNEKAILETIFLFVNKYFRKLFIENEAIKSLKTQVLGPLFMDTKDFRFAISFMKGNKVQLKHSLPFAVYSKHNKSFHWLPKDQAINTLCKDFFEEMLFCKYDTITDISSKEAETIALWYRTMWYAENFHFDKSKNWKTFNLLLFQLKLKNDNLVVYTLSDFGIKNPKYTKKVSGQIGLLRTMPTILKMSAEKKIDIKGGSSKKAVRRIKKSDIKKLVK